MGPFARIVDECAYSNGVVQVISGNIRFGGVYAQRSREVIRETWQHRVKFVSGVLVSGGFLGVDKIRKHEHKETHGNTIQPQKTN